MKHLRRGYKEEGGPLVCHKRGRPRIRREEDPGSYYQAIPRGRGQAFAHHPGSLLAARVTLSRAARSIEPLSRKVYHPVYGDLHQMRVRELRDALELVETSKDIILR
jgi:hypothetical protein